MDDTCSNERVFNWVPNYHRSKWNRLVVVWFNMTDFGPSRFSNYCTSINGMIFMDIKLFIPKTWCFLRLGIPKTMGFPRIKISHLGMFLGSTQVETSIGVYPDHGISFLYLKICVVYHQSTHFFEWPSFKLGCNFPPNSARNKVDCWPSSRWRTGGSLGLFLGPKEVQIPD